VRALGAWAISNIVGDDLFATPFRDSRRKDVKEFMEFAVARDNYNRKFENEVCLSNSQDTTRCTGVDLESRCGMR
jgi:hypothetical protein